jgi:HK97 family phage major capsid protein
MSDNIKDLREQQARILTNARAKFDEIKNDTPAERASEIEREFDAMMADHDKIGQRVERAEKLARAQRALAEVDLSKRPQLGGEGRGVDEGAAMGYREAFHEYLRSEGNLGAMDAEARSILRAGFSKVEHRAQTTSATAGGYTVPTELLNILVKSMAAWGPMYDENVATVITTNGGGTLTMPTVNDIAVTAEAHTEGATLTDDGGKDVTFGQKTLGAYAFNTEWIRVSKELADDSIFAMEQVLGDLLGERLGRIANSKLTTGSGSSDVQGVVTGSSLGVTAAGTAAITSDEIINLVHSVDPAYRMGPKVAFMFNDSTLSAIRKLKDGQGNYLWQMGNVQQGVPGTLLGYRYYVNQAMASLATGQRVAVFGDFSKFYVRKVGAPLIGAIQDKDFWPGFGVAGYIRFDGELADTAAIKHLITA